MRSSMNDFQNKYLAELEHLKNELFNRLAIGTSNKQDRNNLYEVLGVMDYKVRIDKETVLPIQECFEY